MAQKVRREYVPRLIAWEITRKCHLACKHCRGSARDFDYEGELSTEQAFKVLDNIATFDERMIIILTGGEPMARDDVFEIAKYGSDLGLHMVMSPCGQLISDETCEKIKESGIARLSFSIDGATAETHDAFRGIPGAFDSTMEGINFCRKHGISYQINTTVTNLNMNELPQLLDLAISIGAVAFHPFMLVPVGRASDLVDLELSPHHYEEVLRWIRKKTGEIDILLKPTCAPHYQRIIRQSGDGPRVRGHHQPLQNHSGGHPGTKPGNGNSGHPGGTHTISRGCMGGVSFAFISHIGDVQICGFMPVKCGNIYDTDFDFVKIWDESSVFNALRDTKNLEGRCGACEFINVCAGCRARAYAVTENYLAEEPLCSYVPRGWDEG